MLRDTRELIDEIADRHGVETEAVLSHYGPRELVPVRRAVTHALKARGDSISTISRLLKRDRHTIYKWLS